MHSFRQTQLLIGLTNEDHAVDVFCRSLLTTREFSLLWKSDIHYMTSIYWQRRSDVKHEARCVQGQN